MKMSPYQHGNFHYKDKTVHDCLIFIMGIPIPGHTLYWNVCLALCIANHMNLLWTIYIYSKTKLTNTVCIFVKYSVDHAEWMFDICPILDISLAPTSPRFLSASKKSGKSLVLTRRWPSIGCAATKKAWSVNSLRSGVLNSKQLKII